MQSYHLGSNQCAVLFAERAPAARGSVGRIIGWGLTTFCCYAAFDRPESFKRKPARLLGSLKLDLEIEVDNYHVGEL